jgi:hypothetical protein
MATLTIGTEGHLGNVGSSYAPTGSAGRRDFEVRVGLENLNRRIKWSFCLTADTLYPAYQERQ